MVVSLPFLIALILIIPTWRIFDRAGLNPFLSLVLLIPVAGFVLVLAMLAFTRWPSTEGGAS